MRRLWRRVLFALRLTPVVGRLDIDGRDGRVVTGVITVDYRRWATAEDIEAQKARVWYEYRRRRRRAGTDVYMASPVRRLEGDEA